MSLLYWPRDTTPLDETHSDSPPDDHPLCDRLPSYYYERDAGMPELGIILTELITERRDGNSQVFRARLQVRPRVASDFELPTGAGTQEAEKDAVCKVAYGQRRVRALTKESQVYEKLWVVQGSWVPEIYGFFVGGTPEDGPVAVLVMQDCGSALTGPLKHYSLDVRKAAVLCLANLHRAGVEHGDFAERNIVAATASDGTVSVRLVDLETSRDHDCPFEGKIEMYKPAPSHGAFRCKELYYACTEGELWSPKCVLFLSSMLPAEWASGTAEELLQRVQAAKQDPPGYDEETLRRESERVVRELRQWEVTRLWWDDHPLTIDE